MLIGTIIGKLLPAYSRSKHIPLISLSETELLEEVQEEEQLRNSTQLSLFKSSVENSLEEEQAGSVATDIVFKKNEDNKGLVIPVKITTRERIVQPFAHQRILDSVFGPGSYQSLLICVSEMQRDKENNVNEICVPGTIQLFQRHLASLTSASAIFKIFSSEMLRSPRSTEPI